MTDLEIISRGATVLPYSPDHLSSCLCHGNCDAPLDPDTALAALRVSSVAKSDGRGEAQAPVDCTNRVGVRRIRKADPLYDANDAKNALQVGPVFAVMNLYEDFWGVYAGGVYRYAAGRYLSDHAVSVIGYNDEDATWIIKNSQGPTFGEAGCARVAYGECSLFADGGGGYRISL